MFAHERRDVLAARLRHVDRMADALRRLSAEVERLNARVDGLDSDLTTGLRRGVSVMEWNARRQLTFVQKARESSNRRTRAESVRQQVLARIRQAARQREPILAGPWTGEVGFELLYWAPFVRWAIERFGIEPARVTLLSRGGTASWYGVDGVRYLDVLDLCSPDEFRRRTMKERKQRTLRAFDRHLVRQARERIGRRAALLHPAMMYALFEPFWTLQTSLRWVQDFTRAQRIVPPAIEGLRLPQPYVAVRFYFSKCFRETPGNHERVRSLIRRLAAETNVVVLGSGVALDEHREIGPANAGPHDDGRHDRVHTVEHLMRPETNLAVQTAVIAGAQAFIGTYGGFSYLAPLCGVNSVALYSQRNYYPHHLDFARHVFQAVGGGSLSVIGVSA